MTRTAGRRTSAGGGYLTIGAGGRTDTDDLLVGQAFEPGEPYGQTQAAEVFAQRTGRHRELASSISASKHSSPKTPRAVSTLSSGRSETRSHERISTAA